MNNKDDAEIGQTVHLRPTTKTAPTECYLRLRVELISVAAWPMCAVWVRRPGQNGYEINVHRDNIGLHAHDSKLKKTDGDGTNTEVMKAVTKPAFRPHKPLSDGDWEEPVLF